jgi:AraC-like DNA-binding protein
MNGRSDARHGLPRKPKLYMWKGEMLFLGTFPMPHRAHKVAQDKLVVCLEGNLKITCPNGDLITVQSCLLRCGLQLDTAQVDASKAVVGVFYLATFSQDFPALESIMQQAFAGVAYGHPSQHALIEQFKRVRDGNFTPQESYAMVRDLMIPAQVSGVVFKEFDPRVLAVVQTIRNSVRTHHSVRELAAMACLSESRFEKLFKEQTGLPVTQYRLRFRVYISAVLLAQGYSVTDAALIAGFSNTAHFSRTFSAINGLPPSNPFLKSPFVETLIDEELLELVRSSTNKERAHEAQTA